jgi:hypothetical protein
LAKIDRARIKPSGGIRDPIHWELKTCHLEDSPS